MSKRAFDIIVAGIAFVLTSPIAMLITLALLVEDKGPVIRPTVRVGRHGRPFVLLRFRTMPRTKGKADLEQTTPVGQFIRNYSLDDLPQLYNVLKGDMSIIGPRPFEIDRIDPRNKIWQQVWKVKPGLISYAILELNRNYNDAPLEDKLRLETTYVKQHSLGYDLKVFCQAISALVLSKGNVKLRG